jgi:NADPH:quinone reductase-like Zn-dependent oxidoreductase
MRAIVLEKFGRLDSLVYKDIPELEPKAGHVVIEIKALGINHAEMHMRRFSVGTRFASAMATAATGVQGLRRTTKKEKRT